MSDANLDALLRRVGSDDDAFDAFYAAAAPLIFGVALRILRDRAEAEDALQEAFVKIWRQAGQFRGEAAAGWIATVARNAALDRLRRAKARPRPSAGDPDAAAAETPAPGPTPEEAAAAASERGRIDDCLDRLEPRRADAVRGAYLDGDSYQELSERFDVPLNTMRTWLRRSLIALRDCLER